MMKLSFSNYTPQTGFSSAVLAILSLSIPPLALIAPPSFFAPSVFDNEEFSFSCACFLMPERKNVAMIISIKREANQWEKERLPRLTYISFSQPLQSQT